jgi:hypothetical protein
MTYILGQELQIYEYYLPLQREFLNLE